MNDATVVVELKGATTEDIRRWAANVESENPIAVGPSDADTVISLEVVDRGHMSVDMAFMGRSIFGEWRYLTVSLQATVPTAEETRLEGAAEGPHPDWAERFAIAAPAVTPLLKLVGEPLSNPAEAHAWPPRPTAITEVTYVREGVTGTSPEDADRKHLVRAIRRELDNHVDAPPDRPWRCQCGEERANEHVAEAVLKLIEQRR